ncbi:MAG: YIP1 family protein [Desulfobaccales bacterium]|nr:YIP1 family protein [Desulfobaccales bacterium]
MTLLKEDLPVFAASGRPERGRPIPWEDPDLPRLVGFFRTLKKILLKPGEFFRDLPREGWAEALAFGLIVGTTGLLAVIYWKMLLGGEVSRQLAGIPGASHILTLGVGAVITGMLLAPLIILAALGLGALGLWVGTALVIGAPPGFPVIMRITCYGGAGLAAALVPFLGGPAAGLWVVYLTYRGVKTAFSLSTGRALGVLAISLGLKVFCIMLFLGSLMGLMGLMGFWLLWG